ncbi:MAG TPA: hypothetical protein VFY90_00575, partial [Tepidiformaceae bacterium]|nr:hypothetical protein [Tepidiformaceae bacterium]
YQVGDSESRVLHIGFAGARELFGLRSALDRELAARPSGARFRYEVNTQYQTRWRELLMLHQRDHGDLPDDNHTDRPARLGYMR